MDGDEREWKSPPSGGKWITPMKNHLEVGGASGVRDMLGLAARVVGEVGFLQPRTVAAWAISTVTLYYIHSASSDRILLHTTRCSDRVLLRRKRCSIRPSIARMYR